MELNYDTDYWTQPCPKIDCHKKACECGLAYVPIPAALEATNPPKNGAYCNAIVEYLGSGKIYVYSEEGVPVSFNAAKDYEQLSNKPQINSVELIGNKSASALGLASASDLTAETTARKAGDTTLQTNIGAEATARQTADTTLQTNIESEATTRANADDTLQANITAEVTARKAADTELTTKINQKQDQLTAGENITLDGATISASFTPKVITIADANYPADAPTKVYPGYLETGSYYVDNSNRTDTFVYTNDTVGEADLVTQIIVGEPFTNRSGQTVKPITYVNAGSIGVAPYINFYASTTGALIGDVIKGTMVADNLTTTINPNWVALSANQGKILNDKIGDIQTVLEAI